MGRKEREREREERRERERETRQERGEMRTNTQTKLLLMQWWLDLNLGLLDMATEVHYLGELFCPSRFLVF